jgi:uncharacterized protein involved in type VI secretion and phage assembly
MTSLATAAVELTVDGQRFREPELLRSVRVASRLSQPAQCELVFALGHGEQQWPSQWSFGARLAVQVAGSAGELFAGEVTCVELWHAPDGNAQLRVRAYDLLHRLRKRQQLRVFEDVTAADLLAALAGDLGVEIVAPERGPRLDRVVQHRQRDFELLVEVAAGAGLYPVLGGGQLRLVTLAGYGEPVVLELGRSLWEARVTANLDRVASRVTALGWHSQRAEFRTEPAVDPRAVRADAAPEPRQLGVDGERFLVNLPTRSDEQLAGYAQAALDADTSRAVTVSGVADGEPRIWAGRRIVLKGVPAHVDGGFVITEAVHTVDANGYQTAFSTEPPEPVRPADPVGMEPTVLTLGKVTGVDDPQGHGRVRVSLPAHGDLDAGWLSVLCPGAGQGRGLVALPDVGDTVAVALPRATPADGIVLGSLFGAMSPPDTGVEGGAVRRWSMRTAAGQSVVVDDANRLLRIENEAGSVIELGPSLLRLHAATDLVIEAPGRAITVRASSVDFEHAAF